jgi:hypothetical protein
MFLQFVLKLIYQLRYIGLEQSQLLLRGSHANRLVFALPGRNRRRQNVGTPDHSSPNRLYLV